MTTVVVVRRGTCRVCKAEWQRWAGHVKGAAPVRHPITDASRMTPHLLAGGTVGGSGKQMTPEEWLQRFPNDQLVLCAGVGTLCDEAREIARLKRFADALAAQRAADLAVGIGVDALSPHERKLHLIRIAGSLARVVLDALLIGEASVKFNVKVGTPFRLEIPWLMRLAIIAWREATEGGTKVAAPIKTVERAGVRTKSLDVYCTFCGELIRANVAKPRFSEYRGAHVDALTESTDYHTIPCAMTRLSGMQAFVPRGTFKLPADSQPDHTHESTHAHDEDV